jgi:hypothetical protein
VAREGRNPGLRWIDISLAPRSAPLCAEASLAVTTCGVEPLAVDLVVGSGVGPQPRMVASSAR